MTVVGELALWAALFLAAWAAAATWTGRALRRPELVASGVRAVFAATAMTTVAALGLWAALFTHDFSLAYVVAHTTVNLPVQYLVSAFWAGPEGATLAWTLALALCGSLATGDVKRVDEQPLPYVAGTVGVVLTLALVVVCFADNPYDRVEWVPAEGRGLPPQLQNPWAVLREPAIFAGYATTTISFALAVSERAARRVSGELRDAMRLWSFVAWATLTLGIGTGMRWAYLVPEWRGLWPPGAMQSAALLLWIINVAALRLARRVDRRRSMPRRIGAYGVIAGLALLLVGLVARRSWTSSTVHLHAGEATELTDPSGARWRFVSQGVSREQAINYIATAVALDASRRGQRVGILGSEQRQYFDSMQRPTFDAATLPGIRSFARFDLYIALSEVRGDETDLRIGFNPLVACIWTGWAIVFAGGVLAGWPTTRKRRVGTSSGSSA